MRDLITIMLIVFSILRKLHSMGISLDDAKLHHAICNHLLTPYKNLTDHLQFLHEMNMLPPPERLCECIYLSFQNPSEYTMKVYECLIALNLNLKLDKNKICESFYIALRQSNYYTKDVLQNAGKLGLELDHKQIGKSFI